MYIRRLGLFGHVARMDAGIVDVIPRIGSLSTTFQIQTLTIDALDCAIVRRTERQTPQSGGRVGLAIHGSSRFVTAQVTHQR